MATSPKKENVGTRAPKAQSAKPPPRDYHDLFVGNDSDASPAHTKDGASSPKKEDMTPRHIAPKGGAGKNYQPSRLFDTDEAPGTPGTPVQSPEKPRKPDPKKYNHFNFDDGDDAKPMPARPKSKHQNNWDFEDFTTPKRSPRKSAAKTPSATSAGKTTSPSWIVQPSIPLLPKHVLIPKQTLNSKMMVPRQASVAQLTIRAAQATLGGHGHVCQ